MPGTVLSNYTSINWLDPHKSHKSHFTDEETEARKIYIHTVAKSQCCD